MSSPEDDALTAKSPKKECVLDYPTLQCKVKKNDDAQLVVTSVQHTPVAEQRLVWDVRRGVVRVRPGCIREVCLDLRQAVGKLPARQRRDRNTDGVPCACATCRIILCSRCCHGEVKLAHEPAEPRQSGPRRRVGVDKLSVPRDVLNARGRDDRQQRNALVQVAPQGKLGPVIRGRRVPDQVRSPHQHGRVAPHTPKVAKRLLVACGVSGGGKDRCEERADGVRVCEQHELVVRVPERDKTLDAARDTDNRCRGAPPRRRRSRELDPRIILRLNASGARQRNRGFVLLVGIAVQEEDVPRSDASCEEHRRGRVQRPRVVAELVVGDDDLGLSPGDRDRRDRLRKRDLARGRFCHHSEIRDVPILHRSKNNAMGSTTRGVLAYFDVLSVNLAT